MEMICLTVDGVCAFSSIDVDNSRECHFSGHQLIDGTLSQRSLGQHIIHSDCISFSNISQYHCFCVAPQPHVEVEYDVQHTKLKPLSRPITNHLLSSLMNARQPLRYCRDD